MLSCTAAWVRNLTSVLLAKSRSVLLLIIIFSLKGKLTNKQREYQRHLWVCNTLNTFFVILFLFLINKHNFMPSYNLTDEVFTWSYRYGAMEIASEVSEKSLCLPFYLYRKAFTYNSIKCDKNTRNFCKVLCAKKVICNVLLKPQTSKAYLKIENLKRSYLMKIIKFSPGIARMLRKIFDPCTAVKHFKYKCHWISLIKIFQREKVAHTTKCEKYVSGHKRGPSVRMHFLYFFTSFLCIP